MLNVTLFTREGCHLCEQAKADLQSLQAQIPHHLVELDIEQDDKLLEQYALEIPVIQAGPYTLKAPFDRQKLQMVLGAANDRRSQLEKLGSKEYEKRVERGKKVSGADRFTFWFANHYLFVINAFILLYVGLPILAPVLMQLGLEGPAMLIYKIYGGMCHQLSYRSWFLFGEQPVYPRAVADIHGYATFFQATGLDENGIIAARNFVGNAQIGYKMALCQRDIAIYGAMFIFGVLVAKALTESATASNTNAIFFVFMTCFFRKLTIIRLASVNNCFFCFTSISYI